MADLPDAGLRGRLADALDQQAEAIVREWLDWLHERSLTRTIHALPEKALENHIPPVVRCLAAFLRNPVEAVRDETIGHLRLHAQIRKEQGYDIQELMVEFDQLAQIINRRMARELESGGPIEPRAVADTFSLLNTGQRSMAFVTVGVYREKEEEQEAELSRRLKEFAETLAHEVRQPLQTVSMGAEMLNSLANGEGGDDSAERNHYMEVIQKGLIRTQQLIDDLRMLAASEGARLERSWAGLREVVDRVVDELRPMASKCGVELTVADRLPEVELAALPVQLALLNLVNNAIKYADDDKPRRWVNISATWTPKAKQTGLCRIAVEDNGKGITAEAQPHVFQRHFRAHPELNSGLGLGLAIARHTLQQASGSIWMNSEEGSGTTFYIEIDAVDGRAIVADGGIDGAAQPLPQAVDEALRLREEQGTDSD